MWYNDIMINNKYNVFDTTIFSQILNDFKIVQLVIPVICKWIHYLIHFSLGSSQQNCLIFDYARTKQQTTKESKGINKQTPGSINNA